MANNRRYVIWDEKSKVITPSGAVFTPEQWLDMYPMAKEDDIYLVLSGGKINGAICNEYSMFVDIYAQQGCDFSNCETMQDHLDAIEAFEDARNQEQSNYVSDQTRTADALEDLVVLTELSQNNNN